MLVYRWWVDVVLSNFCLETDYNLPTQEKKKIISLNMCCQWSLDKIQNSNSKDLQLTIALSPVHMLNTINLNTFLWILPALESPYC